MPLGEIETHPYLDLQLLDGGFNANAITRMIVGTFPIYSLTDSDPIEEEGQYRRQNWQETAHFQYFYGSQDNHLWNFVCNAYNDQLPENVNVQTRVDFLNRHGIILTDAILSAQRVGYSPADGDLRNITLNHQLPGIIESLTNLSRIIFTSGKAKSLFCQIIGIGDNGRIQETELNGQIVELRTLPTPAGGGRSVPRFFQLYPLTEEEAMLRENGEQYALRYRQRLYSNALLGL